MNEVSIVAINGVAAGLQLRARRFVDLHCRNDETIIAAAAIKRVVAFLAVDVIVVGPAPNRVITTAAEQCVLAATAED